MSSDQTSSNPVIAVRNLSKSYKIYDSPRELFVDNLFGGDRHDIFWAVRNVSFEIFDGERVGVLGPNGAGKTTLLQLITGNVTPTSGTVTVNGSVSAMLSLTSFLNPNDSGLENIRFNLTLNGVPKRDLGRLTEEIVEFAELGSFIHAPVRTYSTGMNARLAFSIATVITPDVLLVDEVLGVGDAYFSAKAMMRMVDLCNEGRALLFVSHSISAIQMLCNRAIWMENGGMRAIGPVDEVVAAYEDDFRRAEDERVRSGNAERRQALRHRLSSEELLSRGALRLRLIGPNGRLGETHYVRRIHAVVGGSEVPVSLYVSSHDTEAGRLDLEHSEWGRAHSRRGSEGRALAPSPHPLKGGHILLDVPEGTGESAEVSVTVESIGATGSEQLVLEAANLVTGRWQALATADSRRLGDGWTQSTFAGSAAVPAPGIEADSLDTLLEESRGDVEIVGGAVLVNGREVVTVREREPFDLEVTLFARRRVACVDVGLKLTRGDGTYIFWQSSGQSGKNLVEVEGTCRARFRFNPNIFGAGDYQVQIDLGNGYDVERNFPQSEIFDRRLDALRFTVTREWPILNLGPLNYVFPVDVTGARTVEGIPEPAGAAASSRNRTLHTTPRS